METQEKVVGEGFKRLQLHPLKRSQKRCGRRSLSGEGKRFQTLRLQPLQAAPYRRRVAGCRSNVS